MLGVDIYRFDAQKSKQMSFLEWLNGAVK